MPEEYDRFDKLVHSGLIHVVDNIGQFKMPYTCKPNGDFVDWVD